MGEPPKRLGFRRLMVLSGLIVAVGGLIGLAGDAQTARGHHKTPPSRESRHAGHEVKDINVRRTAYILAGMAVTAAFVVGIVFVMIWRFHVAERQSWASLTPEQTTHLAVPEPRLEVDPVAHLLRHLASQNHLLHSYGWVDQAHGIARIPIQRAMALTVGKSLDAQP